MLTKEEILKTVPQTGFVGQPKGLFTLFFTEFWERFSYYGMRAILLYYMYDTTANGGLGLAEDKALIIMSLYGALIYMSGIIGGWIADRITGTRKAIFYGGILIMLGHIALSLPFGATGLYASMVFIIVGTGLLKPNVSAVVGDLYADNDGRRDAGFSIFYMGINLGAFISALITGGVQEKFGYHPGFLVAAVGMAIGLVVYLWRQKDLGLAGSQAPNPLLPAERKKSAMMFIIGAVVIAAVLLILKAVGQLNIENFSLMITVLAIAIPVTLITIMYRSKKTTTDEKSRVLAYIPLFVCAVMFWAIADQSATVLAAFVDKRTDLSLGSFNIPAAWFQSLNPMFIIMVAPLFALMWTKLGDKNPATPKKFALSLFFSGASFLIMIVAIALAGTGLINPLWVVASFFLVVVGELLLSPVGLSATTKLAPKAFAGQTMALWFLASAAAQAINSQLVRVYSALAEGNGPSGEMMYFGILGGISILVGIILLFLSPMISRAMRGIK